MWSDAAETALANEARDIVVRDGKTAFEIKWGRKPTQPLLPFGCEVWTLVEPSDPTRGIQGRDKFDARAARSIFIGYEGGGAIRYLLFA